MFLNGNVEGKRLVYVHLGQEVEELGLWDVGGSSRSPVSLL